MKTNTNVVLTAVQLRQAADLAQEIEAKTAQLDAILNGENVAFSKTPAKSKGGKRTLTQAQKDAIAAGQRKRWKKFHASQPATPAAAPVATPAATPTASTDAQIPAGAEAVKMVPPPNRS